MSFLHCVFLNMRGWKQAAIAYSHESDMLLVASTLHVTKATAKQ